jgi:hypothetical protein
MLVIAFPLMAKEVALVAIRHLNFMRAKGNRICRQRKSKYCHTCPGSKRAIVQVCIDNEMKVAHPRLNGSFIREVLIVHPSFPTLGSGR